MGVEAGGGGDRGAAGGGGGMKNFDQICDPDNRYISRVSLVPLKPEYIIEQATDYETVPWDKAWHYKQVQTLVLPSFIPKTIATQFDVALNTALYAYFCWELWDVAAHKSVDCLELVLRKAIKRNNNERLNNLIDKAASENIITIQEKQAVHVLRRWRNELSHGYSGTLGIQALSIVQGCRILIVNLCKRSGCVEEIDDTGWGTHTEDGVTQLSLSGSSLHMLNELAASLAKLREIAK
jgi:hypothetical protein